MEILKINSNFNYLSDWTRSVMQEIKVRVQKISVAHLERPSNNSFNSRYLKSFLDIEISSENYDKRFWKSLVFDVEKLDDAIISDLLKILRFEPATPIIIYDENTGYYEKISEKLKWKKWIFVMLDFPNVRYLKLNLSKPRQETYIQNNTKNETVNDNTEETEYDGFQADMFEWSEFERCLQITKWFYSSRDIHISKVISNIFDNDKFSLNDVFLNKWRKINYYDVNSIFVDSDYLFACTNEFSNFESIKKLMLFAKRKWLSVTISVNQRSHYLLHRWNHFEEVWLWSLNFCRFTDCRWLNIPFYAGSYSFIEEELKQKKLKIREFLKLRDL
ncbi:MAG: hypothetical protein ACD_4C00298G0003 [uncultured bacterium (gcode 4)]|uniref:Uncharacterized protein n=1 Tax=uncultured bacterium (gcode 4) TaxID=1234023 RepID=K2FU18_9BACT|nr:MAG: hypothetical protein ACD_4C00298G0003 [uncultured bacterium (gcode 4)]